VTDREIKNLPASIHQRLLNKARESGRPFNELLQYYAIERFLYRLAQSPYQDRLVLKGALIFAAWGAPLARPTHDVDLLAYTSNRVEAVVAIVQAICAQAVEPDGMVFDEKAVVGETIKEHADYQGVRVRFRGRLGTARVNMQIDFGFADVVSPSPERVDYPSLLGLPRPRLKGYPRETVVAEKTQALVALGAINSRMKDFYDLWLLAHKFDFEVSSLSRAIVGTFARRETAIPTELPEALGNEFARIKQSQWQAFLRTSEVGEVPQDFATVLKTLREFLWPVLSATGEGRNIQGAWRAAGSWQI